MTPGSQVGSHLSGLHLLWEGECKAGFEHQEAHGQAYKGHGQLRWMWVGVWQPAAGHSLQRWATDTVGRPLSGSKSVSSNELLKGSLGSATNLSFYQKRPENCLEKCVCVPIAGIL